MWIITKDHIDGGDSVNVCSTDYDKEARLRYPFKIYDDDGELYYEGISDDHNSEEAFAPLDDYAMPNAGATEIRYRKHGTSGPFESL